MSNQTSLFSQVVSMLPRKKLQHAVYSHQSDRHSKGFRTIDHLLSMLFCQLARATSLREIENGLRSCEGKINHLGMNRIPTRSNLSYVNKNRDHRVFQDFFYAILECCRQEARCRNVKFRIKKKVYSLDASVIQLCLDLYDWARYRRKKGAIKLHFLLDHDGYLPCFVHVTQGRVHEVNIARTLELPQDSIVVMDRGYNDYNLGVECKNLSWVDKKSGKALSIEQMAYMIRAEIKREGIPARNVFAEVVRNHESWTFQQLDSIEVAL